MKKKSIQQFALIATSAVTTTKFRKVILTSISLCQNCSPPRFSVGGCDTWLKRTWYHDSWTSWLINNFWISEFTNESDFSDCVVNIPKESVFIGFFKFHKVYDLSNGDVSLGNVGTYIGIIKPFRCLEILIKGGPCWNIKEFINNTQTLVIKVQRLERDDKIQSRIEEPLQKSLVDLVNLFHAFWWNIENLMATFLKYK